MMRTVMLVILSCLLPFAVRAQPIEFKGVRLGASTAQVAAAMGSIAKSWNCAPEPDRPARVGCVFEGFTYAGVEAMQSYAYFDGDKLSTLVVHFPAVGFAEALGSLSTKYGKPKRRSASQLQNGFGATFEQLLVTWARGPHLLTLQRFGKDTTASAVVLVTEDALKEQMKTGGKPDI